MLEKLGGKVLDTYWLIQGAVVDLPIEAVKELTQFRDVQYLDLADEQCAPAGGRQRQQRRE